MQLASMWSIFCNIQHLVHQHSQHRISWSMLPRRTFRHYWLANTANRQTSPHDEVSKWINTRVAWNQNGSEPLERCAACDSKRCLLQWNEEKLNFLRNEEKEKWIEDHVKRDTSGGRKRVRDTETAIQQVQDDLGNAEKAGFTTTKPETIFEGMLNAIGDRLSGLASFDDDEDGADEGDDEEDPAGGKLSEDDEPGWVMSAISQMVQYLMERIRQK